MCGGETWSKVGRLGGRKRTKKLNLKGEVDGRIKALSCMHSLYLRTSQTHEISL